VRHSPAPPAAEDPASDEALVRSFLQEGDERAFRELYRRHSPAAYGLLCRLTGGREHDAAEVLQEAWIRAVRKLATFRGGSAFRTWLTGIAVNCYREWRRERARSVEAGDESVEAAAAWPEARQAEIEQVLHALPAPLAEALILHDVEGWTHEEIAGALAIEAGTSKSRLARARRLFRQWWRQGRPEVTRER
jgi:RNA polymerase sigma-70 factor (ECF subfamily)